MAKKIYALLVGINDYAPPVAKLTGCLNDVDHFHEYLSDSFSKDNLNIEVLKNGDATRGNIIKLFRDHLCQATKDDVAVFHYCGHGARSASAKAFHEFYPDGKDEGLVCIDSRLKNGFDLADKELAKLIAEVAVNNPHIAVILDCCHSGSGTRDVDAFRGLKPRVTYERSGERPLDSYLDGFYATLKAKEGEKWFSIPGSKHILLAACERTQSALENPEDHTGVFTSTLVEVLSKSKGSDISYADLFVRCRAAVRSHAENQNPQFEPYENFNVYTGFLGQQASAMHRRYSVYFEKDTKNWKIDAGAVAPGIPTDKAKSVGVALYRESDPERSVGNASIIQVGPQTSILQLDFESDPGVGYQAEITSLPIAPMPVYLDGDSKGTEIVEKAWQTLEPELKASLGVDLTRIPDRTRYAIAAEDGKYILKQRDTNCKILGAKEHSESSAKSIFFPALKQVAQWERSLALQNHSTKMNKDEIDFDFVEILDSGEEHPYQQDEITLDYVKSGDEWKKIRCKIRVRNRTGQRLHFLVLYFSSKYGIFKIKNDEIEPSEEYAAVWGTGPKDYFSLDDIKADGMEYKVNEEISNIKLIVSTEKIDDFLLALPNLKHFGEDMPTERGGMSTFEDEPKMAYKNEWFSKNIRLRMVRQLDQVGHKDTSLAAGKIVVKKHPSVKANLSLRSAAVPTRSAAVPTRSAAVPTRSAAVPTRVVDDGSDFFKFFERQGFEMVNFAAGTRGDSENILELTGIENAESLRENPLEIEVNVPLKEGEGILPFVFDGQHAWLGGNPSEKDKNGTTHISIDHLPAIDDNRRSLTGSLKLYFFKTYLKRTVNQLRWVEFKADGSFEYQKSPEMVAEKVAAAQNILLLVHGIIGDTEAMAKGVQATGLDKNPFDLVLAYDYENLSTPIEETAKELKSQLAAVGLQEHDNKKLTLLVHSMGGLVSRWFVEREGGNRIVDHLVMCGTPNNGSPFGEIDGARKILNVLTGVAINFVPMLIPFSGTVLLLLNRSKKITPTLEQMNPQGEFIKKLNASDDPGIRYTILAGDVEAYKEPSDEFFAKMLAKIGQSSLFETLFGKKANDIAVSVDSILGVGSKRAITPIRKNVGCHHLNYFVSDAGQDALKTVEW